jgi:hypothetical protein
MIGTAPPTGVTIMESAAQARPPTEHETVLALMVARSMRARPDPAQARGRARLQVGGEL